MTAFKLVLDWIQLAFIYNNVGGNFAPALMMMVIEEEPLFNTTLASQGSWFRGYSMTLVGFLVYLTRPSGQHKLEYE